MSAPNSASFNNTLKAVFNQSEKTPIELAKDGDLVIVELPHEKYQVPIYNVCSVRKSKYKNMLAIGQFDYPLNNIEFSLKEGAEVVILMSQSKGDQKFRERETEEATYSV